MATKLKNLRIRKVDFVDEGANPDAHIGMVKRKDGEKQMAEENSEKNAGFWKRLLGFIGNAAGMGQEEIDSAMETIQKGDSVSFREKINEISNRKIADEIWDICYALQSSLCSILNDEELDSTSVQTAMQESLDEFYAVVQESISKWSSGKSASIVKKNEEVSEADLEIMKSAVARLNKTIEKASKDDELEKESEEAELDDNENPKGDEEEMKIDKSKLTDAERAFLESIEKRYGDGEADPENRGAMPTEPPAAEQVQDAPVEPAVTKSASQPAAGTAPAQQVDEADNIYKGLHPAVRAELEGLKKFREAAEDRELAEVAKRYAIIGKKEEDLVPVLKNLRAAGGTAYQDMIAVLDQAAAAVENSGVFSEIGKSGHGSTDGSAWAEAEAKAAELMKSKTGLSKAQALDEVLMTNPELAEKCEKRGFKTKKEAVAWAEQFIVQQSHNLDMTFKSFWELYRDDMSQRLRENTVRSKDYIVELKILPYFGERKIADITAADIRQWQNGIIKQGYAQTYLKTINNQLSAIFNYAVKYNDLPRNPRNPCSQAGSMGKGKAEEMQFWTQEEFETRL